MMATNDVVAYQPLLKSDSSLGDKSYLDFGKWNTADPYSNSNAMWLFWSNTNGVLKELSVRAAFVVFGSHNAVIPGGTITLIQHTSTAYFSPAFSCLWGSTANTRADRGVSYLDRTLQDGRALAVPSASYHLVEALPLQVLTANTFAKDRALPGFSGGARICEVIVLTSEPSDAERLQIEDYLWRKWIGGSESSVGPISLANGASLDFALSSNRVETTVSGKGTVNKSGSGTLVLQNAGSGSFNGSVGLREGSLYAIGEPFRFDLAEGGQSLSVENIKVDRTNGGVAGAVTKTGSGELAVASVSEGVTNIAVTAGALRLAPPRTADAVSVTAGAVNEPSLEAFTNGMAAGTAWVNYTPQSGPWTATVNGWRFDRSSYTSSGNFLVGVGFDYNRPQLDVGTVPDGHAVLYLNFGLAETDFTVPTSGLYRLTFWAAGRLGSPNRYVDVRIDGAVIRTIITPGSAYWKHAIRLPHLSAGAHTIGFRAYGADLTRVALVDDIRVEPIRMCATAPVEAALTNAGFELSPALIEAGAIATNQPAGTGWTFEGDSGIGRIQSLDSSSRTMQVAVPEGVAAAFVNSNGCVRQTVAFPTSGVYRLSFQVATRIGYAGHAFNVLLASNLVSSLTSSDIGFRRVEVMLPAVTNAAGASAELAFQGQGGIAGTLFDDVRVERVGDLGLQDAIANGGFEAGDEGWTFTEHSGTVLSGMTEGWANGPEIAPYGNYLAYMLTNNVLKQAVTLTDAGNYAVRFVTKSRRTAFEPLPFYHCFDVTFNGVRVGSVFNANGNTVRTYEFSLPSVAAGVAHDLEFRGRYASPATISFLDGIEIVRQKAVTCESLTNRYPEHLVLEVAQGAGLVLDYEGAVKVETVKYGGRTVSGTLSAGTHPEFVSGTGSLFSPTKGTLISVQ
jgi:hypothetical protein